MAIERHVLDRLMLSLFDKEATYDAGPAGWTSTSAVEMLEYEDASAHEEWDDLVVGNEDVVLGSDFPTSQEIARQSVRINYTERRAKPNSVAGLLALALGKVTATQDGLLAAYRHKIENDAAFALPSIGAQTKHDGGRQYKYTGIKADRVSLSFEDAHLQVACNMVGSGSRALSTDAFAPAVKEDWLRRGDAKVFLRDTGGTAITIPAAPTQGSANIGAGSVNVSSRVLELSFEWNNNLAADQGYRLGSGKVRSNLHPARRSATVSFTLEVDDVTEATELDYYLNQAAMAVELNIDSGKVIASTGVFKFGLILIVPLVKFRRVSRGAEAERETLAYEGRVLSDGTNPLVVGFVYNAQPAYLA